MTYGIGSFRLATSRWSSSCVVLYLYCHMCYATPFMTRFRETGMEKNARVSYPGPPA